MKIALLFRTLLAGLVLPLATLAQITVNGVADKTNYNDTATLTVVTQAGYSYSATLNYLPVATGAAVVVNKPDFYELRVDATDQTNSAVTSLYRRFIVKASERVNTEWGLPPHVPFPMIQSCSNEFVGAHFRLLMPSSFPTGYAVPIVTWIVDAQDKAVRANGILKNSGVDLFKVKRGAGSGFIVSTNGGGTLALALSLPGLTTNVAVTLESNVTWTSVSGTLSGSVVWTNHSRIQITAGTTIPAGSSLTVGAGTIVRVNPGVDITNNGTVTINGTVSDPVVFMSTTTGTPWGGFVQHANNASFTATGTIFTGSGEDPCWFSNSERGCTTGTSGLGSHRTEQPLVSMNGLNCNLTMIDSAAIYLAGQVTHAEGGTKSYDVRFTRFLMQRATSCGQFTAANLTVNDSAFIEVPDESVNFEDEDHDAMYIASGTHFFTNTLFGWTKDDGVDSGGGGYGPLTYQSCWFESTFHEGNSWSGYKNVFTRGTVYFDCGQGVESGYDAPTGRVDSCFFSMNETGIRHGDNYDTFSMYDGRVTATNNISIYNHRDLFGFNWDNSNNGGWTNSYDRFWPSNNLVTAFTAADTNYPNNTLWNPVTDGWRLAALGGVGRAGVGFGVRGTTLAEFPDGIPVGLSRFCTNEVQVGYTVDGTDGTHTTGTLVFPAGLTRRFIPAPVNTNSIYRFALVNPVNADVTGQNFYIASLAATTPTTTLLVATNAVWKYFDQTNDLGTAWRALGYNDAGWSNGAAQLGFGETDQATTISNYLQSTVYFRRTFTVTDPAAFTSLSLWLLRDDAGVVLINGSEVFRSSNLPAFPTAITNRTLATVTGENSIDTATLAASNLVAGANILAVEIHQQATNSSDVSFALSLTGNPSPARPRMALTRLANEVVIYSSDNTAAIEEASDVTGPWTTVPNVTTPTGVVPVNGQRFYRLRR